MDVKIAGVREYKGNFWDKKMAKRYNFEALTIERNVIPKTVDDIWMGSCKSKNLL